MRSYILPIVLAGLACALAPRAGAQEPLVPHDSLERRVAGLEAQIDSLRHVVAQLAAQQRDTVAAKGELEAMRARAVTAPLRTGRRRRPRAHRPAGAPSRLVRRSTQARDLLRRRR